MSEVQLLRRLKEIPGVWSPNDVWKIDINRFVGLDERSIEFGVDLSRPFRLLCDMAQLTRELKRMSGEIIAGTVQPFSWDFVNNKPLSYTPPVHMWELYSWNGNRALIDNLVAYDVGDPLNYEVAVSQGDVLSPHHYNCHRVPRAHVEEIVAAINQCFIIEPAEEEPPAANLTFIERLAAACAAFWKTLLA